MSFKRQVPKTRDELGKEFETLFQNKSHVKHVEVNLTSGHLEVTLDWLAHTKVDDFYLPLKRAKINDARKLVETMIHEMDTGFAPSGAEIQELFDMIDPSGQ